MQRSAGRDAAVADTLAAAYAERQRFADAAAAARRALGLAGQAKDAALAAAIGGRIQLYDAGLTYRDRTLNADP